MHPMRSLASRLTIAIALVVILEGRGPASAAEIDLSHAMVVVPDGMSGPENKAVRLLVEEVRARTGITWDVSLRWPSTCGTDHRDRAGSSPAGGYQPDPGAHPPATAGRGCPGGLPDPHHGAGPRGTPAVLVAGNDARGVLFGVGRLLRGLHMRPGKVSLPEGLNLTSAPKYPLRGHQLGYRPKTNSYDAWDLPQWERYIRELAVFGTNAIELIPPRSDDDADSPHFPLPPLEMMAGMSGLCADYGLDVWIWYPAMDADYSDPGTVEHALKEWGEVFKKLPRIDAVFVPGGDPGHTRPRFLMALLEKQAANLRRYHPERADVGLAAELLPGVARRVHRA